MALSNLAGMFGNDPTLVRDWYSDLLTNQQDLTTGQIGKARDANQLDLANFSEALKGSIGRLDKMEGGDVNDLTGLIRGLSNPDAMSLYRDVGNYRTGLLKDFSANLSDVGSSADKLAQARLGYGGRGPSTYQSNTLIDRISKNLVPAFQSVIGSIGTDTNNLAASRRADYGQASGLLDQRATIPLRSTMLRLLPIQARNQILADEIGNETALGSAYRNNLLGTHLKTDRLTKVLSGIDDSTNTGVDMFMNLVKAYASGGAGGAAGGAAGLFGGAGGGGGGASGGGGGSLANLIKMFGFKQGGRNTSSEGDGVEGYGD